MEVKSNWIQNTATFLQENEWEIVVCKTAVYFVLAM